MVPSARLDLEPRVGVNIDCPPKDLFHDPRNVIITSQISISDLADNDNIVLYMGL